MQRTVILTMPPVALSIFNFPYSCIYMAEDFTLFLYLRDEQEAAEGVS